MPLLLTVPLRIFLQAQQIEAAAVLIIPSSTSVHQRPFLSRMFCIIPSKNEIYVIIFELYSIKWHITALTVTGTRSAKGLSLPNMRTCSKRTYRGKVRPMDVAFLSQPSGSRKYGHATFIQDVDVERNESGLNLHLLYILSKILSTYEERSSLLFRWLFGHHIYFLPIIFYFMR